jgi:hypothetical protein
VHGRSARRAPGRGHRGIWGLEEVAHLVTHPEEDPPEHFADLVADLRDRGYDPAAFDPVELTRRLSGLQVRTAATHAKPADTRTGTRRPVDDDYLTEEPPAEAEVFPVITLPPPTDLAAQARRAPLIDDALRLAEWCSPGRQVTATGVLKPAAAREAVEELRSGRPRARSARCGCCRPVPVLLAGGARGGRGRAGRPGRAHHACNAQHARRRHVAAGVLANLGEEPPLNRETVQQWLLIDRLTAFSVSQQPEILPQDLLEAITAHADDLWRSGHPAAADTIDATATALREGDKTLAKRLRRCAHKARARSS